jgi:hypothetical protein
MLLVETFYDSGKTLEELNEAPDSQRALTCREGGGTVLAKVDQVV